ncbi:putative tagatose-6-phosphate ketose/aldose isomerase [Clostridium perfringens]|uniref:SIS domain-containing protein n=1 Tax=Clostridium perfringens TaxID=1502 RepID=UPI001A2A8C20|nr:SIS domain-containing protein [Clostridium perfringens]MDG6879634.1 putative tagatose-6-phosphate ketose/aldose isomerase [Clostridium perfringens]HAT4201267.1 SIS domain-containing protein [Clostridium perfringens]HAT4227024.1 SIS domain-containing protein [Clostridium perfringens]HAT4230376.1 SIS domain-containing protein [Clostridium perfringens]HAT4281111.1 SIS domain-containing protein [Clostridium perfringens]
MNKIFGFTKEELSSLKATYTANEIYQQPELWKETLNIVENNKEAINKFLEKNLNKDNVKIILTGAGTSAYVGDTIYLYLAKKLGKRVEAIATTDFVSNPDEYIDENANTLLVSYARSGNSPESVGTYDLFEKKVKNLAHIVVTCNKEGELAKKSQEKEGNLVLIMPEKSNDKSFAMTSSFTCMTLATLLLFDIANLEKNKKIVEELATKGQASLDNQWKDAKAISDLGAERIVYVGSGALKGLCHEMALKNLELTSGKQVTVCESILGFRHGPKSIINNNTLVIFLCSTNYYTALYDYDLIKEVYNDEGTQKVAVLSYFDRENLKEISHKYITANGSKLDDTFIAFNYIIFGQMISFFNSLRLGISPDNPRPDGTVNRVVQGVIIHEYNN